MGFKYFPSLHTCLMDELLRADAVLQAKGDVTDENGFYTILYPSIGHAIVREFPGCCGIAVLFNAHVYDYDNEEGIWALWVMRLRAAKAAGYTKAMATLTPGAQSMQAKQLNVALELGFVPVETFVSERTENEIVVLVKDLYKGDVEYERVKAESSVVGGEKHPLPVRGETATVQGTEAEAPNTARMPEVSLSQ